MKHNMSHVLFIGPDHGSTVGGREQLSRLHHRALTDLLGDRLDTVRLSRRPLAGRGAIGAVFTGEIDGVGHATTQRILAHINAHKIDQVWIDGSNLGALAKAIRSRASGVAVTSFFHNIEARFFLGALRHRPSLRAVGIVGANFAAERMAVGASTRRVALNHRDSDLMMRLYGRGADHFLPMALPATATGKADVTTAPFGGNYLLFVGGNFYANQSGILWYAKHVAPRIELPTLVVGRGLEALSSQLSDAPNIVLIGAVEALDPYYRHAKAVVAPIFDGSGMKTKVAEAMMHGKRIIGTREAFVGYEHLIAETGWQCANVSDFLNAVRAVASFNLPPFERRLQLLFDDQFSYEAARRRIATIVGLTNLPVDEGLTDVRQQTWRNP
jgi:glycosyltransferase involved in cell wall biosynthesis